MDDDAVGRALDAAPLDDLPEMSDEAAAASRREAAPVLLPSTAVRTMLGERVPRLPRA